MIKLYRYGKLKKTYKGFYLKNILDCAEILREVFIASEKPWIDLMTKARNCGYNLQSY